MIVILKTYLLRSIFFSSDRLENLDVFEVFKVLKIGQRRINETEQ
jgi:hypothetical protein